MFSRIAKVFLPDRPVPCRILRGPFRGARMRLNPRSSLRKIFGLYEHELNGWVTAVLPKVNTLYDVGANDGYFTVGCMAWFTRSQSAARVYGFEPETVAFQALTESATPYTARGHTIELVHKFVGDWADDRTVVLDDFITGPGGPRPTTQALVKIDVEGAEAKVLRGATRLLHTGNYFLVEIHSKQLIEETSAVFRDHGVPVELVSQRPLPILGREQRSADNWWLVSKL